MINKQGQKIGPKRGSRRRFPYEPRVIGGKLLMPAELQAIHRYVVETPVLEVVTDEVRAAAEAGKPRKRRLSCWHHRPSRQVFRGPLMDKRPENDVRHNSR